MKIITTLFAIILNASLMTSWAEDKQQPGNMQGNMHGMNQNSSMINMQGMHNHMRNMEKIMEKMHVASTDKQRSELMGQHMQEMHKGMELMGPMMNMMIGDKKVPMSNEQMAQQLSMMDQRIDMMQQMMQHMMDQQSMMMREGGKTK